MLPKFVKIPWRKFLCDLKTLKGVCSGSMSLYIPLNNFC